MPNRQHARSRLVLIVDDDVRTARILARMLREDGFEVELAASGAAAVERLSRMPLPQVLLTGMWTPHIDGMAVAQHARSRYPALPVFVLTEHVEQVEGVVKAMSPPPKVFAKPIEYADLALELGRVIDAAHAAHAAHATAGVVMNVVP